MDALEIIKEFDGIIGALSGVIVTLLVTEYLKNKGKLSIYVVDFRGRFYTLRDRSTGGIGKTDDDLHDYSYELELNIYNSSDTPKIMRNMLIEIFKKDVCVLKSIPKDTSTRRSTSYSIIVDDITVNNIPPKEIQQLKLQGYISESDLDKIKDANQLKFTYIDEKNNKKEMVIHKGQL